MMMRADQLQKHILATYFNLRVGVAVIALLFPVIFLVGGNWLGIAFQPSMSDYYHTPMRNGFVGMLFIIGSFLYLYRGYSNWENWLLNAGGLLALGVALLPTDLKCIAGDLACTARKAEVFALPQLHGICAVGFFICIAAVSVFCSRLTLALIKTEESVRKKFYTWAYRVLAFWMIALPALAAALSYLTEYAMPERGHHVIFWVEFAGVWVFALYWIVKSFEIRHTEADLHAANGTFGVGIFDSKTLE